MEKIDNRIIIIKSENKKEKLNITWHDFLRLSGGYTTFKELKEKYNQKRGSK